MKTSLFKIALLAGILLSFGILSCSDDDGDSTSNEKELITRLRGDIQNGSWRITEFIEDENDETHHFAGYSFTFGQDGNLTAANGTETYQGTWIIRNENSDDNDGEDIKLIINFSATTNFEELNEDWLFVSHSSSKIDLTHISGGDGGTDHLTFEKS